MTLQTPVTVQPPTIYRPARGNEPAQERVQKPITLTELDLTIVDNEKRKLATARIHPFHKQLTLWDGAAYDAAGDYTQADVEARVLSLLGTDIKASLEALFIATVKP
jgi:hypothetical protein